MVYKLSPKANYVSRGIKKKYTIKEPSHDEILDNSRSDVFDNGLELAALQIEKEQEIQDPEEEISCASEEKDKSLEILEEIVFESGKNKLSLKLMKTKFRYYKIKIFLNDFIEIRPSNYVGSSAAYSFWNLLKDTFKK